MEFEYALAEKLGLLVSDLRRRMTNQEFVEWKTFFARRAQREELEMKRSRASRGRG